MSDYEYKPPMNRAAPLPAILLFLVGLAVIVLGAVFISSWVDCDARHGVWVETMFGYECVQPMP